MAGKREIEEALDRVTVAFMAKFAGSDIKAVSIMTSFALPRDAHTLKQVYDSLHDLSFLDRTPAVSQQGSTIFYATYGEVIESTDATMAKETESKAKEEEQKKVITYQPITKEASNRAIKTIARAMGRAKDAATKAVDVYLFT